MTFKSESNIYEKISLGYSQHNKELQLWIGLDSESPLDELDYFFLKTCEQNFNDISGGVVNNQIL